MVETLEARIKLDDRASRQLKKIDEALRSLDRRMGQLNTSSTKASSGLGALAATATKAKIGIAAVGVAAVATTRAVIEGSRAYENTVNQLKLVTKGTEDYNRTIGRLTTLAQENRTSFDSTVELYTKLRVATEELGYSTDDVEQLTTKLSQALAVAGADAGTANGVIRQFGQAMASGVVRGDEFNSIVEGLGPALNIMARESGINVGKLREMAQNGELTAKVFSEMLLGSNALSESFNKLSPTIDQVEQKTNDSFTRMMAAIGEATGVVDLYKASVEGLGIAFDGIAEAVKPEEKTQLQLLQEQAETLDKTLTDLKANAMAATGVGMGPDLLGQLGAFQNPNASQAELDRARLLAGSNAQSGPFGVGGANPIPDAITNIAAIKELEEERAKLNREIAALIEKQRTDAETAAQTAAFEKAQAAKEFEARKQALALQIQQKVEAAARAAEMRKQKELMEEMAAAQEVYARSRMEGLELERQKMERLAELMRETIPDIAHQEKYAALHKDASENIALMNRELTYNRDLTRGQRREYRMAIDDLEVLKEFYHAAAKSGEVYTSVVLENELALRQNNKERMELERLLAIETRKLEESGGANTRAAEAVRLLTDALDDNKRARAELMGTDINMTLGDLEKMVGDSIKLDKTNMDLYNSYKAAGASAKELEEAQRILGITFNTSKPPVSDFERYEKALKRTAGAQKQELGFLNQMKKSYDDLKLKVGAFSEEEQKVYDLILKRIKGIEEAGKGPVFDVIDTLRDRLGQLAISTADTFTDVILGLKNGFEALEDIALQVLRTIISTLIEAQIRKYILGESIGAAGGGGGGLMGSILGGLGGLGGSTVLMGLGGLGLIGGLIGGFLADGGPAKQGVPYVVGERGPELFVPNTSGTVVSNEEMNAQGGQGDLNVNFTINAIDTQSGVEFLVENKRVITGVIQEAYMRRGSSGPLG